MTQLSDLGELTTLRAQLYADASLNADLVKVVLNECVDMYLTPYRPAAFIKIAEAMRNPPKAHDDAKQDALAGAGPDSVTRTSRPQSPPAGKGQSKAPAPKGKA